LKQLKGIGSVFAKRILKYRNLLGGYYSTEQLREVYNFPIEILPLIENQIIVDTLRIKKIRINFAEYRDLLKHPYFNKKQVEAILEYRNKNGPFDNLNQLELIPQIDSLSLAKIKPYITCR
jgi:DNA uptake protein ComE-like DNA-binding protein